MQDYGATPLPNQGLSQSIQPIYPVSNGTSQYNRKVAMALGITQIAIGIICLILNVVLIIDKSILSFIGFGIWGGILIFVAGLLQVLSAKVNENKCLIIGTMVMTIIAACDCGLMLPLSIVISLSFDGTRSHYEYKSIGISRTAMGTAMAILIIAEAIIAITSSVLCCGAVCCKSTNRAFNPANYGNQLVIYQANNPGTTLPPVQTPLPYQPSAPQVNPNPQVSGLARDPPPNYDNSFDPGAKPNY